jgi:hypothetical protein
MQMAVSPKLANGAPIFAPICEVLQGHEALGERNAFKATFSIQRPAGLLPFHYRVKTLSPRAKCHHRLTGYEP